MNIIITLNFVYWHSISLKYLKIGDEFSILHLCETSGILTKPLKSKKMG